VYSVRQHRVTASFLGLVAIVTLVATLLPKGDASAATSGRPAVLTPSTAYFITNGDFSTGSPIEENKLDWCWKDPVLDETQNDCSFMHERLT